MTDITRPVAPAAAPAGAGIALVTMVARPAREWVAMEAKLAAIAALVREHLKPTTYFALEVQRILDAPSVGAAQPQDTMRGDLIRVLSHEVSDENGDRLDDRTLAELADKVLAVVRPADGVLLNREAVLDAIRECAPLNMELRPDGTEDPSTGAYVEGVHAAHDAVRALAAQREAGR